MYRNIHAAVVGSINMDLILEMNRIPNAGENLVGTAYSYANGGKGANQAVGLSRLGAVTKIIGKVADDPNGNRLLSNLEKNGVDVSSVSTMGTKTGIAVIILDGSGNNRIIVYEGANAEINGDEAVSHITNNTDLLLVQFETSEAVVVKSVRHAVKNNITTVIDCGPAKDFALEEMQGAEIITPNESETKTLTGIYPENEETALEASKILMQRSLARYVVLKLGEKGCAVWDSQKLHMMPAYKTKVVDTTAAGDCFTAAMALEYVRSGDIIKACDIGNKAGSISVGRLGADASMPCIDDILKFKP